MVTEIGCAVELSVSRELSETGDVRLEADKVCHLSNMRSERTGGMKDSSKLQQGWPVSHEQ